MEEGNRIFKSGDGYYIIAVSDKKNNRRNAMSIKLDTSDVQRLIKKGQLKALDGYFQIVNI